MSCKAAVLVLASWFTVISCQDRGAYYDSAQRTWQQSSTNCQLLGAWDEGRFSVAGLRVPARPPGDRPDQFYWIGARAQQTPWFTHLGCFETQAAPVQRDISNETDPTFSCYLFCASFNSYFTMGISRQTCYCYDDVHKYRKAQEQCYYQTFPNNQDELYGAPNAGSVIVFTYHSQTPVAYSNDFGNCASFRYLGSLPVTHQYSSCYNRLGTFCTNGQTQAVEIPWTDAVKRCGTLKTELSGYYSGLTESIKYRPLWTGFYRRSIEEWTPPRQSEKYGGINLHSFHCVAVKVNNDGTIFPITYPQLCTKTLPSLCERSTAVDGNWAPWSAWSTCPVTCGGGTQERKRSCTNPPPKHGGKYCVGEATETQTCNAQPCPVDGNWSPWSDYGDCSNKCGHGQQTRTRTCTNPKPEHGGKLCEGEGSQQQACIGCPANKKVTDWTTWSACSTTCGDGSQRRTRKCDLTDDESNAHNCRFSEIESRSCNPRPCPIDGNWSPWTSWGKCSNNCGRGKRSRRRDCNNPPPEHGGKDCLGDGTQEEECTGCPLQRNLTPWTTWSVCSVTCGDGSQARSRQCDLTDSEKDQEQCYYKEEQKKKCQTNTPCPIDGSWSSWTKWGDCCVNSRSRSRTCDNPKPEHGGANCVGDADETGSCLGCPGGKPDPIWTSWDICPVTCGGGVTRRSRSCNLTPDEAIRYKCFKQESQMKSCSVQPCPVDGGWTLWTSWGSCSNNCGHGQKTRERSCTNPKPENGGKPCTGDASETKNCYGCPGGKVVTNWSPWGQCSVSCGGGVQNRSRDCGLTSDEANKYQCYYTDKQSQACNTQPCPPINGNWSPWSPWGTCSVTCGEGTKSRTRTCTNPPPSIGGTSCPGQSQETTKCTEKPCSVDGGWTLWTSWSSCSNNCGHGQKTRERSCTNPKPENGGKPCTGDKSEVKNCYGCPGGKVVTNWSPWGQCSVSCGGGVQNRSRDCGLTSDEANKYQCYYTDKQSQACNTQPCPPVNGNWSPWSPWGTCSVTCGEGTKSRTRTCTNPPPSNGGTSCPGQSQETTKCTEKPCSVDGGWTLWTSWSSCSNNCGHGQKTRERSCTNPKPENGGKPCTGDKSEVKNCYGCPGGKVVTNWSPWGQCSVSCGGGVQNRSRDCGLTSDEANKYQCYYTDKQRQTCNTQPCPPVNGNWSPWSPWGTCSVTCGEGTKSRTRTCTNPPPSNGGTSCPGQSQETTKCTEKPCSVDGGWTLWTSWGSCSNNCGHGQKTRERSCTNPKPENGGKPCTGDKSAVKNCYGCPGGKVVTNWSPWGQCSVSCGGGIQKRSRDCGLTSDEANKYQCYYTDKQSQACNTQPCPPINGNWSPWSPWGTCSVTCGEGTKSRTRTCTNPPPSNGGTSCPGQSQETTKCTEKPCSGVGVCVKSCLNLLNGDYQSCESCRKYVTCSHGIMYVRDCPNVLVWDDVAKRCLHTSTTCNIQTPLSSETSRMKRALDQNMKHSSTVGQFQGYNWTILISSAVGGVAIVALVAVAIKLEIRNKYSRTKLLKQYKSGAEQTRNFKTSDVGLNAMED